MFRLAGRTFFGWMQVDFRIDVNFKVWMSSFGLSKFTIKFTHITSPFKNVFTLKAYFKTQLFNWISYKYFDWQSNLLPRPIF